MIFRHRFNACRAAVWLQTFPEVMRACFPTVPVTEHRQDGYVSLPNGSEIWFAGLDEKERVEKILGLEFDTVYFNECSQIPRSSVLTALTRLAKVTPGLVQRAWYDLNPVGTGHWTHRLFIEHRDPATGAPLRDPSAYAWAALNPTDNRDNLSPEFLAELEALPERERARFFEGRYVAEVDGALWTLDRIEATRWPPEEVPSLRRVVVAVDPSGTKGEEDRRSDEVGIVVAGEGHDGTLYLLEDASGRFAPEVWGRRACELLGKWQGDRIVGERNFGGDMVRAVIQSHDRHAPYREVVASRGKVLRAEPIAALYERGKVRHAGRFPALEDQLCRMTTAGYVGERSPDRADAWIHAATELVGRSAGIRMY